MTSMHFYGWKNGLKTGQYYLRSRPARDAIKFTVNMEALLKAAEAGTAEEIVNCLQLEKSPTIATLTSSNLLKNDSSPSMKKAKSGFTVLTLSSGASSNDSDKELSDGAEDDVTFECLNCGS
jgi:hypothetical protein